MDKCVSCRYNTNSYVCHPHCSGCDGKSNYERGIFKMKGYNELATIIHKNAVSHGWWEKERSFAEIVALIHSELSEALEEYRDGKPMLYLASGKCKYHGGLCIPDAQDECPDDPHECGAHEREKPEGIVVELADAIIRILDYCGFAGIDIDEVLKERRAGFITYTLPELVTECHYLLSKAYRSAEPCSLYFAECISLISFWVKENGGDLDEAIVLKHEYNKSRPYRHGRKKC